MDFIENSRNASRERPAVVIILRYFSRELLLTTMVVTIGLLLVTVGGRFSQYLDQAATGDISPEVIFVILAYRLPRIITLILPVAFFVAVLIAYGRLYVDSEMVVLSSCGFSKRRLVSYTLLPASLVAVIVGLMSLFVIPASEGRADEILVEQRSRSEFEVLPASRFHQVRSDQPYSLYFQNFADNRSRIEHIFIAEMASDERADGKLSVVTARVGTDEMDPATGHRYLVLRDGYQYIGQPGALDYQVTRFEQYRQFFKARDPEAQRVREEYASTRRLVETDHPAYKAELQWRLSLPALVLVIALLAVPLSYTNPRRGRFLKLVPSLILVLLYLVALQIARNAVEERSLAILPGLIWVHGAFLVLALLLLAWNNGQPLGRPWRRFATEQGTEAGGAQT